MGRIQSDVGLVTGLDIGKTVKSLMALAAKPRNALAQRTDLLKQEQLVVTELSALLMAVRYVTTSLGKAELYQKRVAASSNENLLSVTVTGAPETGVYQFTPIRPAQQHQLLSNGLRSSQEPLGGGTLTFRFGDHVQRSASIESLNGGSGIVRGRIRIIDRSGASAEIDLSTVQTLDDVLEAINRNTAINVTATTHGRAIRLIDNTGQSGRLRVQEVGQGTTAASLGLAGIDTAQSTADGLDILRLSADIPLEALNDGNGVAVSSVLPDISYTLRDGTAGEIDFSPLGSGGDKGQQETSLGAILQAINAAAPGKLKAEIAADGTRLVLTDLTSGEGTFALRPLFFSHALSDLGLDRPAADGVLVGRRLLGGLKAVLLSSLNGGQGLGNLGTIRLTDRTGTSAEVDLSAAETLEDVIDAINAAGVQITARVNNAKNGILLTDTSGAMSGRLVVADADGSGSAARLQIAVDAEQNSIDSGDLHLKIIAEHTRLSSLNGGAGISRGKFAITDTSGATAQVDLARENVQTVGDLLRAIDRAGIGVQARINDTGDGLMLVDVAHGPGTLRVADVNYTTAAELRLLRSSVTRTVNGVPTQVIDGSHTCTVQLGANETLQDLRRKIEAAASGVIAQVSSDGSARPYRLSLTTRRTGRNAQLVVDTSALPALSFTETSTAKDALLLSGSPGGGGLLMASPTNEFSAALPGASILLKQASASPVSVTVSTTDSDAVANVMAMVQNYNRLRKKLAEYTAYDAVQNKPSVLTGDAAALRMDTDTLRLLSGRLPGAGSIQTLAELGINLKNDGTLDFDEAKFKAKFAADPEGVKKFFTADGEGFSAKFDQLTEQLVGVDVSLMAQRFKALDRKIKENEQKIAAMDRQLETQQQRLYLTFYKMEVALGRLKNQLNTLNSIQWMMDPTWWKQSKS